jgi:hypothetical protein
MIASYQSSGFYGLIRLQGRLCQLCLGFLKGIRAIGFKDYDCSGLLSLLGLG